MFAYETSLQILHEALTFGIDPSLGPITEILDILGKPQENYPCVQVAGTNGKSSTARFIATLLRSQDLKVGLYTSPELVFYEERIEVDGAVVPRRAFAEAIGVANAAAGCLIEQKRIEVVTEFELLTAAALWLYARQNVDVAVLECGLGGRWDATSVVDPRVAVITGVDLDHTAILGNTVEQIAAEKAAIIKPGCIPVLGPGCEPALEVFLERCREVALSPRTLIGDLTKAQSSDPLSYQRGPAYQHQNLKVALLAAEAFLGRPLDYSAAQAALDSLVIPGRFELLSQQPFLLIDAAHNPQSARSFAQALQAKYQPADLTLLLGILADKDARGIITALVPLFGRVVASQSTSPRAIAAEHLAEMIAAGGYPKPEVIPSLPKALDELVAADMPTVVTGSITVAGEAKAWAGRALSAVSLSGLSGLE